MPGTRAVNCRELRRQCELQGTTAVQRHLAEALEKKHLASEDFSLRELAESFMGAEWVNSLRPKSGRQYRSAELLEAGAVRYSDFSNITGQIVFTKIREGYQDEEFVFTKRVPAIQSDIQDMEKIPGMAQIGDEALVVAEGNSYPYVAFSEDYIHVAAKQKRGMIVALTREAILGDKTGLILQRARRVGFYAGLNLEKRVIDAFIDENGGAVSAVLGGHRYYWKDASYATHQTSSPWVNVVTSNALVDWTDVEGAYLKFVAMKDPYTNEPIMIRPKQIVVTPQLLYTAKRVVRATEIRVVTPGYATSGNPTQTQTGNPVENYEILSSQLLADRAATDTDWWLTNISETLNRFYNWDIETDEAPANHPDAFLRDIVMQVKVTVKDAVSVVEPRAVVESRA